MRKLLFTTDFSAGLGPFVPQIGGGGWGNKEMQRYTHQGYAHSRGGLTITAFRGPRFWESARLDTRSNFSFVYGKIEALIRVPRARGIWPAFWLCGAAPGMGWPTDGEIDIMEVVGKDPDSQYHATIHGPRKDGQGHVQQSQRVRVPFDLSQGHHLYAVEWTPTYVQFELDGHPTAIVTREQFEARGGRWVGTFDKPQGILLNVAVGGDWNGAPDASTPEYNSMHVQWLRVWQ